MKRREFIISTAGVAGILVPAISRAARPCPPPTLSVAGGSAISTACTSSLTYSTNFPGTENPISESGAWSNIGLDWTSVRTTPGLAFGTNGPREDYDDSYAHLSGFGPDHSATATIYRAPNIPAGETHEVEILVRWSDSAHSAKGYEVNLNYEGNCQIVRWNGPIGSFQVLNQNATTANNGDVLKVSIVGSVISAYVNGALVVTATDSTHSTGNPGIGFFKRTAGLNSAYGFSNFSATSL